MSADDQDVDQIDRETELAELLEEHGEDSIPQYASVRFSFDQNLLPWSNPEDYVTEIEGAILYPNEVGEPDFELGTVEALKVHRWRAREDAESLHDLADAHSAELQYICWVFFNKAEDPRRKFSIDCCGDLLVLWGMDIPERYQRLKLGSKAFANIIETFGMDCLIVAHRRLGLSVEEFQDLGFVNAAGTEFCFIDSTKRNPYRDN